MNQSLIPAVADKLSALETVDYLRQRAERAISRISIAFCPGSLIPNPFPATNGLQQTREEPTVRPDAYPKLAVDVGRVSGMGCRG